MRVPKSTVSDQSLAAHHLIIDERGEAWEVADDEFNAWVNTLEHGAARPIDAVARRGFIHLWVVGCDVFVSLWPERVNPVTMVGAIDELVRLGQDWTIVCSLAPGGKDQVFRGYSDALLRIEHLMQEAGKIKSYPDYDHLIEEARQFAQTKLVVDC
jgi:hypothetical protein